MDIFTWLPNQGVDVETNVQVREIQLGEGVVQVQQKSLTPPKRKFTLEFDRRADEIDQIYAFLVKQRGNRFIWQRAKENIKVRCTEFNRRETGLVDTLRCVFQEEFY